MGLDGGCTTFTPWLIGNCCCDGGGIVGSLQWTFGIGAGGAIYKNNK